MRGLVSHTLVFKDTCRRADDAAGSISGGRPLAAHVHHAVFHLHGHRHRGLRVHSQVRAASSGMPPVKRRMYPAKQIAVAEMWVKLEQTRAPCMLDDARVDPPRIRLRTTRRSTSWRTPSPCARWQSAPAAGIDAEPAAGAPHRDSRCGADAPGPRNCTSTASAAGALRIQRVRR